MSATVRVKRGGRTVALGAALPVAADEAFKRVPPGGTEEALRNERGLLACVLRDPAILGSLEVEAGHFCAGKHTAIFGAMRALADRGEPPDLLLVSQELERTGALPSIGGPAYLGELNELEATTANATHYAGRVRSRAMRREVMLAAQEMAELAQADGLPDEELIEAARARLEAAVATGAGVKGRPVLLRASDVKAESVEWLWPDFLAMGHLGLIAGPPGCGKSTILRALAAAVTTGAPLPLKNGQWSARRQPRSVVMMIGEDAVAKVVVPHLRKLGADLARVEFLVGCGNPNEPDPVGLADVAAIEEAVRRSGAGLLIVDPWTGFTGGADTNKSPDVRALLMPLGQLAERFNVPVVMLAHVNKRQAGDGYNRVSGSGDLYAQVRHVLLAGKDPSDASGCSGRGVLVCDKNNVGPKGHAIGYAIVRDGEADLPTFEWTGPSKVTTADLLVTDKSEGEQGTEREEAIGMMRELLADGPRASAEVERALGCSKSTFKRAKRDLGVLSSPVRKGGRVVGWLLKLPGDQPEVQPEDRASGPSGEPLVSGDLIHGPATAHTRGSPEAHLNPWCAPGEAQDDH